MTSEANIIKVIFEDNVLWLFYLKLHGSENFPYFTRRTGIVVSRKVFDKLLGYRRTALIGVVYLNEELWLKEQKRLQDCDGEKPEHLTDEQMQQAAARLHFSETAFITRLNDRSFAIRYFTPAAEVPLCGHASFASFS